MTQLKLLTSLFCTAAAFLLLNLFLGPAGPENQQLSAINIARLEENITNLKRQQNSFLAILRELKESPQRIRQEAREYGFLDENEGIIRFTYKTVSKEKLHPGYKTHLDLVNVNNDVMVRALSLITGLACFVLLSLLSPDKEKKRGSRIVPLKTSMNIKKTAV